MLALKETFLTGLVIAKGPQGPPGLRGVVGREGLEGLPGMDGVYGNNGIKGIKVNIVKTLSAGLYHRVEINVKILY